MKTIQVQIPGNFYATPFLPSDVRADKKQKLQDGMYYIRSLLIPTALEKKKHQLLENEGFIPLQATILLHIIGPDYKGIIDSLTNCGVMQINNFYSVGESSKSYRLT